MFERFDDEARAVVVQAQIHARRLGHRYLGCEHLLLAMTSSGTDLSRVLGASGLTPSRRRGRHAARVGHTRTARS